MSVEDLVAAAVDDVRIRVPRFQRRMRWSTKDVRNLLDSKLLDAVDLSTWLVERFPDDKELQRAGHDVGRRIREYKIPIYVVTTDEEPVLQEIFRRLNRHGVAMTLVSLPGSTRASCSMSIQMRAFFRRSGFPTRRCSNDSS